MFVVDAGGHLFIVYGAYILLNITAHDHDLPFSTVFGDAAEARTTLTSRLQSEGLCLATDQNSIHLLYLGELLQEALFPL